ncbi:MAG: CPBP family intramembrane metalloprotease [Planctomycetes bacterium]|nr:CPBP family intramembrane metalloprotease [Planctomycetota bacterium]
MNAMNLEILVRRAFRDLFVALLIGVVAAIPFFTIVGLPVLHVDRYVLSALSPNDSALEEWLRARDGVDKVTVARGGDRVEIAYRTRERSLVWSSSIPPWSQLGYGSVLSASVGCRVEVQSVFLACLLASQAGFFIVGLHRVRSSRAAGEPFRPLVAGSFAKAAANGLVVGAALVAFGFLYDRGLRAVYDPSDQAGLWGLLRELDIGAKIALVVLGAVVAPICEEAFFRGAVYGSFVAAGRPLVGAWLSAIVFSSVHFDLPRLPALMIYGLVLAWLYDRQRSLVAPIVAHVVNNATAFALILAGVD